VPKQSAFPIITSACPVSYRIQLKSRWWKPPPTSFWSPNSQKFCCLICSTIKHATYKARLKNTKTKKPMTFIVVKTEA